MECENCGMPLAPKELRLGHQPSLHLRGLDVPDALERAQLDVPRFGPRVAEQPLPALLRQLERR